MLCILFGDLLKVFLFVGTHKLQWESVQIWRSFQLLTAH